MLTLPAVLWFLLGTVLIIIAILGWPWLRELWANRKESKEETGANEEWAVQVREFSFDRDTIEVDMIALRIKLVLEDYEIDSRKVVDKAVLTLTDDEAWAKHLASMQRNKECSLSQTK